MPLFKPNIRNMKQKEDIEGLIKELMNKDSQVRINAVKALSELKHTKGLIEASKNDDSQVRIEAISALANEPDAIEILIDTLTNDKSEDVWQKAFETFTKLGIKDERMWTYIAMELLKGKRYKNALICFDKVAEIKPDKETYGLIGATLIDSGMYDEACGSLVTH